MASEIDEIRALARLDNEDDARLYSYKAVHTLLAAYDAERALREAAEEQLRAVERERDEATEDRDANARHLREREATWMARFDGLESQLTRAKAELTRAKAEGAREALERHARDLEREARESNLGEVFVSGGIAGASRFNVCIWASRRADEAARIAGEEPSHG